MNFFPNLDWDKVFSQLAYNPKEPLIFNSGIFFFLFTAFMLVYVVVYKHNRLKNIYLTLFSIFFYYKSSGLYFLLLITSAVIDYNLARLIALSDDERKRKFYLVISLVANLGMLLYFKYTNFFIDLTNTVAGTHFSFLNIFLPVGISFFTFQSLSYTIDIYRRHLEPVKDISEFAFFVTFFPQMVAGPIVRAADFLPQVRQSPIVTSDMFGKGVFLILTGLFKKAIISDYISANFVDRIFENPTLYTGFENLMGVYGYALQIYCDFSGYTDMAIGIALLIGYKLPVNFDSPYQSASVTEFWRRWHISLSSWLRDYLYISLGGNRKGKIRTYINLFITMLLGGLWHGAALRFVLWGALHGLALGVEKFVKEHLKIPQNSITKAAGIFLTFHFVCFCWIFFRATDMHNAGEVLGQIATSFHPEVWSQFVVGYTNVLYLIGIGYALHFLPRSTEIAVESRLSHTSLVLKTVAAICMIFLVIQFKSADIQPFIYFQF